MCEHTINHLLDTDIDALKYSFKNLDESRVKLGTTSTVQKPWMYTPKEVEDQMDVTIWADGHITVEYDREYSDLTRLFDSEEPEPVKQFVAEVKEVF